MKRRLLALMFLLSALLFCLPGCSFLTLATPFTDINKLGTVLESGKSITIQDECGTVTVEYVAPTRRRIILNGESREFSVYKSWVINGVFAGEPITKLKEGPIGDIYFLSYNEETIMFSSNEEYEHYLDVLVVKGGDEHRTKEQLILGFDIGDRPIGRKKYLGISILKYQFTDED